MTLEERKECFQCFIEPYKNGRSFNETDKEILAILANTQLDILTIFHKMTDMPQIERCQRLISDMNLLRHIWKKAEGTI